MNTHTALVRCIKYQLSPAATEEGNTPQKAQALPRRTPCLRKRAAVGPEEVQAPAWPSPPPSHPAWVFYIYLSLSSFAVAVVNLPFSKFNKKLIGGRKKKKRRRKVISTLTIKGQLTSQFSSGQEKKSGIRQGETQFSKALPLRISRPAVSRVLCPLPLAQFQPGIIFSALREARIHSALLMTRRSAATRAFGSVLPAGCHSSAPTAPIMLGPAARFPLSPNISLS